MTHSPEPWRILPGLPESDVPHRIVGIGCNIAILCDEDEAAENAERIVACVNACKGLSAEDLGEVESGRATLTVAEKYGDD